MQFFENFNQDLFEVFDDVSDVFFTIFPFFFTVLSFGFLVIGCIGILIDWIKERKTIQITNNEELDNYEKQNKT